MGRMAMQVDDDTEMDELIRTEVEAAFAGLEASFEAGDEESIKLIEQKGQEVMQSVLDKLEADGELLSSSLTKQIEALSMTKQKALLEEWDESTAKIKSDMLAQRVTIREEMDKLSALNDDYKQLKGGAGGFNRDTIVGGISFLVGLTYVSAALNEVLKVVLGGGNDGSLATVALNGALGAVGVGYYFYRKSSAEDTPES